jgi:hypothetical protein
MKAKENVHGKNNNFLVSVKNEFVNTGKLYLQIIKNPFILIKGTYNVAKDVFYELPKSLLTRKSRKLNPKIKLEEDFSQALAISEVIALIGAFTVVYLFKAFGANDYIASIAGGSIGSYFSAIFSAIIVYVALTRWNKKYPIKKAFVDMLRVVKDCLPAALVLYITEAPIIGGCIAVGMPVNLAVGINITLGMIVFIGVAKNSAGEQIKHK